MLYSSVGCSEAELNPRKLELPSCRQQGKKPCFFRLPQAFRFVWTFCELHSELCCQLNVSFTSW